MLFGTVLAVALWLAAPSADAYRFPHSLHRRLSTTEKNVIVQMFEWDWDSIGQECTAFLGPAGYGFVQVSPPQEHITGSQWWTDYQPVSHQIISKRGNRTQFASMVQACNAAGVQVLADTIMNHMSAMTSGTGVAGTQYSHYSYPGLQYSSFHHCGLEPNNVIVNYDNRLEVQTCELLGLADLDTGASDIQSLLVAYANDLASLGVAGYRLDACKHIAATDLAAITSKFVGSPFITQEVIYGAGEPIQPNEYTSIGDVQEFRYTTTLKDAFLSSGIATLNNTIPGDGWVGSSVANVFVSNHDTERNGNSLNYQSPSNTYILAHVFMLTWPFGTPTVLTSYQFSNSDDGAPANGAGVCSGSGGSNGWLCQHRYPAIANLIPFYNTLPVTTSLTTVRSASSQQLAYGRGSIAFVIINNDDTTWSTTFSTSLPDGTYCDLITGGAKGLSCTGTSFKVSRGALTASVPSRSAVVLNIGARTPESLASSLDGQLSAVNASNPTLSSRGGRITHFLRSFRHNYLSGKHGVKGSRL